MITINTLKEIIENIVANSDEIKKQIETDLMDYGKLLAYAESLSIISEMCDEEELEEIGLDFDIDARYL